MEEHMVYIMRFIVEWVLGYDAFALDDILECLNIAYRYVEQELQHSVYINANNMHYVIRYLT